MSGSQLRRWLASFLLPARHREFMLGDLEELYAWRKRERGRVLAGTRYLWDLLRSAARRTDPEGSPGPGKVRLRGGPRGGTISDFRHAVRSLRRRPAFAGLVVLTVALGVGPVTVVFGMVHELLLRPLPGVANTDEAAHVVIRSEASLGGLSLPDLELLRQRAPGLEGIASYFSVAMHVFPDEGRPMRVAAQPVYGDFFEVLGVRPSRGRLLRSDETGSHADPFVAVISEDLRNRMFGPDANPVGASLRVGDDRFTIIGMAGGGFRGPLPNRPYDVWLPLSSLIPLAGYSTELLDHRPRAMHQAFLALPAEGMTPEALSSEIESVLRQVGRTFPESAEHLRAVTAQVLPGLHTTPIWRQATRDTVLFMGWAVALILAIACANIANLLLFRNLSQRGAIATQRVLGASTWRIARRQLIESVILGGMGGLAALGVAELIFLPFEGWTLRGAAPIAHLPPVSILLLCVVAVGCGAVLLFGVLPATVAGRFDLAAALRASRMRDSGRLGWLRWGLAAGQLGLTLALSVGALMMVRTVANIRTVDTGLDLDGVVRIGLDLNALNDIPRDLRLAQYGALLSAVSQRPGVEAAALDQYGPHYSTSRVRVALPGNWSDETPWSLLWQVSPGWFELFGVEPIHGRTFREADWTAEIQTRVVVTASLARRLFGRTDVVGRMVVGGHNDELIERRIIGVVGDYRSMGEPGAPMDALFVTLGDYDPPWITVLAKADTYSREWADDLRSTVEGIFPDTPIPEPALLTDEVAKIHEDERLLGQLLTMLALFGALMSGTGLYGVVFFLVSSRTREFGIRLALGADRSHVLSLVGGFVARIGGAGLFMGVAGAVGLSSLLETRLFGLEPMDPLSFAGASAVLFLVCLIASWMPARVAMQSDPVQVLRQE